MVQLKIFAEPTQTETGIDFLRLLNLLEWTAKSAPQFVVCNFKVLIPVQVGFSGLNYVARGWLLEGANLVSYFGGILMCWSTDFVRTLIKSCMLREAKELIDVQRANKRQR